MYDYSIIGTKNFLFPNCVVNLDVYTLRLYLLNTRQVPLHSYFNGTELSSLLITINIALTQFSRFPFFKKLDPELQQLFKITFAQRNRLFDCGFGQWKPDALKGNIISSNTECAFVFYRLLFETWKCIHLDATQGTRTPAQGTHSHSNDDDYDPDHVQIPKLLEYRHSYATHDKYLSHVAQKVSNDDVRLFCTHAMKNAVFVGTCCGQKNCYPYNVHAFLDICEEGKLSEFMQFATEAISQSLHKNFNVANYPEALHLGNDSSFSHHDCPVTYGFDIAQEIQPLERNLSLILNGFGSQAYIKHACEQIDNTAIVSQEENESTSSNSVTESQEENISRRIGKSATSEPMVGNV